MFVLPYLRAIGSGTLADVVSRRNAFLALLVTAACSARGKPEFVEPGRADHSSVPTRSVENERPTITASVRGHDGSPLRNATVTVQRIGHRDATVESSLDSHGKFRV